MEEAGHVAAGPRERGGATSGNGIGNDDEDDGEGTRFLLQCGDHRRCVGEDRVGPQANQLFREELHSLNVASSPAPIDEHIVTGLPSELVERFRERPTQDLSFWIALGIRHEGADAPHALGLLGARDAGPGECRRAAGERDEFPPLHSLSPNRSMASHSITSSARSWNAFEKRKPSALAVLRLMTSSNLFAWRIGRSAGLAPAKMRPT